MAAGDRNWNNKSYTGRQKGGNGYFQNDNYKQGQLPDGYLSAGYYEMVHGEKVLRKEYIIEYSKEIADKLGDRREWDPKSGEQNKRSQIRKFYEYVLRIQGLLERKNRNFEFIEAELNRLVPYANYARSRKTVSELFKVFIEKNVAEIQNVDDFTAFTKHFEAIVAYLPKDN